MNRIGLSSAFLLSFGLVLGACSMGSSAGRDVAILQADGTTVPGAKWALVIGCNGYDPNQVGQLKSAVADAKRMYQCLIQNAGFQPDRVQLITVEGLLAGGQTSPDREVRPVYTKLRARLVTFAQEHRSSDVLLVYFAGHGFHSKGRKRDYLAPLDVERADLEGTAISVEWLLDRLGESGARQSVLIVDACRNVAGRAVSDEDAGLALEGAHARGVWLLSSCTRGQVSREDETGGLYTTALVEGLKGAADGATGRPQDGYVTVNEAHAFVESRLEAATRADPPLQIPAAPRLMSAAVRWYCRSQPPTSE